ncbi:hypothetical protein ABPG77_011267 [Micractinium sp. CCAP 211/92]
MSTPDKQAAFSDDKWDRALDLLVRRTCYGALGGAAVALLILRAPTARASALGLGAGFGLGSAYQANQDLFHEIFGVPNRK